MKKAFFLGTIVLFILFAQPCKLYSQIKAAENDKEFDNGSRIENITLNPTKVKNLKTLGLVWGFLKYYHPAIANGQFNWDYELFRILPQIIEAQNSKDRDIILEKWITKLGDFEKISESKNEIADAKLKPDLDWITTSGLSPNLTALLLNVKNAKRNGEHYYIGVYPDHHYNNLQFIKNENLYPEMKFSDTGFRLLALYRYWNMIQYYFPYKYLIGEDWKGVLGEFIPKFTKADNETNYVLAALELVAKVRDTHATIWKGYGVLNDYMGVNYAAVKLNFIENQAVVTGYHTALKENAELQVGDIITKINHKTIDDMVNERLKITPASNYPTQLRNIAPDLLRTNESEINVEFIRNGITHQKTLKTHFIRPDNSEMYFKKDTCFKLITPDIAYLYLGTIKSSYLPTLWKEIEKTKGLIIDLRCYPSEFVVFSLGEYLMPQPTDFVKITRPSLANPGLFRMSQAITVGTNNANYYKGKIVILINELTQSQAEYTTMAFRVAPRATVIGSTTAGADGDFSQISLPGGIRTGISGIGVYYPNGNETQRVGIIPDIEVKPTIKGIKEGRDELLEKGIEIINKK